MQVLKHVLFVFYGSRFLFATVYIIYARNRSEITFINATYKTNDAFYWVRTHKQVFDRNSN